MNARQRRRWFRSCHVVQVNRCAWEVFSPDGTMIRHTVYPEQDVMLAHRTLSAASGKTAPRWWAPDVAMVERGVIYALRGVETPGSAEKVHYWQPGYREWLVARYPAALSRSDGDAP